MTIRFEVEIRLAEAVLMRLDRLIAKIGGMSAEDVADVKRQLEKDKSILDKGMVEPKP